MVILAVSVISCGKKEETKRVSANSLMGCVHNCAIKFKNREGTMAKVNCDSRCINEDKRRNR